MTMRVARLGGFGPRVAIIEGEVPSAREFARIRRRSLPVQVLRMPPGHQGLEFLQPIADCIEDLRVNDYRCIDARFIEAMPRLRSVGLVIDARTAVDLTRPTKLSIFAGPWRHFESLVECRNLVELRVTSPDPEALAGMRSSLTRLDIFLSRKMVEIPIIAASAGLRELSIYRTPVLDMSRIDFYEELRRLELDTVKSVTGAEALLRLGRLDELTMEKCADVGGWESLAGLTAARVTVIDRNPSRRSSDSRWRRRGTGPSLR
jgi:hypothetical protein